MPRPRHSSPARRQSEQVSTPCVPVATSGSGEAGYVIYRDTTATKRLQDEQRRYHEMQLELAHANRIAMS